MNDERHTDDACIDEVIKFEQACESASRQYHEMGDEDALSMANAYAWLARGAWWTVRILLGEADAETAFNDPIRTMVKGFSDEDSNEVVEMLADLWNHKEDEE